MVPISKNYSYYKWFVIHISILLLTFFTLFSIGPQEQLIGTPVEGRCEKGADACPPVGLSKSNDAFQQGVQTASMELSGQEPDPTLRAGSLQLRFNESVQAAEEGTDNMQLRIALEGIVSGGLLAAGFHYLGILLMRRKDSESFYFGMFCLLTGIHLLFSGEGILHVWGPGISASTLMRIEDACFFLGFSMFVMLLHLLYPQDIIRSLVSAVHKLGAVVILLVLVLPSPWYTYTGIYYQVALTAATLYMAFRLGRALLRRDDGNISEKARGKGLVWTAVISLFAYAISSLWELLILVNADHSYWVSLSSLAGSVALSSSIMRNLSVKKLAGAELLSRQMNKVNVGLEHKIVERTTELERINRSLEQANLDMARMETSRRHLLSNISHDLGTPMTLIQGYVEALMDGVVGQEQQHKYLKLIHNRITGLNRLIRDLFQLSKLEARQIEFDIQPVETEELYRYFDERYDPELAGAGLRFETAIYYHRSREDRPPAMVKIDISRIDQVLTNVIYNAVKHTPKGGLIQLHFIVDEHSLVIQVQDNGSGIDQEDVPYIFDRFYKKDKSRNTLEGGSGLGLAIAKEIVDYHGGRIWAQSRAGQGACIAFMLPLAK